jgi:hypothetical protein
VGEEKSVRKEKRVGKECGEREESEEREWEEKRVRKESGERERAT